MGRFIALEQALLDQDAERVEGAGHGRRGCFEAADGDARREAEAAVKHGKLTEQRLLARLEQV